MRLETTMDVINHSRKLHRILADYYHRLSSSTDKARFRILLEYLEEREAHLDATLSELELTTSAKILNNWFTHSDCRERFKELYDRITNSTPSVEYVIDLFIEIDNCLINLYKNFASSSNNDEVRDFFTNLVKLEENHKIKGIKNISQLDDL